MPSRKKVTIVGAGNVGATVAHWAAAKQLADLVLVDVLEGIPQGKALDLSQAAPLEGYDLEIVGSNDFKATADSDLVIITAGVPRKPGMSRDDLLQTNAKIMKSVVTQAVDHSPNCILMVVSNPLDVMVYVAREVSEFPRNRVFGMAGVLDSARFRSFLAEALKCSVRDVSAFVLGGHGDMMVPLARYSTMAGIPVPSLLPKETIDKIIQRTRDGGAEIVNLLKTGSAYYAPAAAAVEMAASVLHDQKRILLTSVYLDGEYGLKDVCIGVPVKLGAAGVEKIIEIELLPDEKQALEKSAGMVQESIKKVREFLK
ncbi:MAG: malate dehydrogenase [Pseudomonadota bacterium]